MTDISSGMVNQMMDTALRSTRRQVASAVAASTALAGSGHALRNRRAATQPTTPRAKPVHKRPAHTPAAPRSSRARGISSRLNPHEAHQGRAISAGGVRRFELWVPPGTRARQRLPLVVMLHGCKQDIESFRGSTRMQLIGNKERFCVLFIEQARVANPMRCWNWFALKSGKALSEISIIRAAIRQVCDKFPIDPHAVALVGLSAGAGMAGLLASRHPDEFVAVAMHAGVPPGMTVNARHALAAMKGERESAPLTLGDSEILPPLLVVQGEADHVVAPSNAVEAVTQWAAACEAEPEPVRTSRRGKRYPMKITDYTANGRLCARLCQIETLGHAWSGGNKRHAYSDPEGPDASLMSWRFIAEVIQQRRPRSSVARKHKEPGR
ncbi:MAG: PHB depolymerase family esterase [Lautropia sp.]|nr:PHB depolymerase family esterase [Lautropia sp.]